MKAENVGKKVVSVISIYIASVLLPTSGIRAEPLKILVFTEDQTSNLSTCGVSYETLKYNVEAAIRYNQQLPVSENQDLYAYLNMNALEIDNKNCGVSFSLEFYKTLIDSSLPDGKLRPVIGELCQKGGLFLYSKTQVQAALSDKLRNYVDECLARILK